MPNKVNVYDDVDRTIHDGCSYIQKIIKMDSRVEPNEIAEVTEALAKLVTARALLNKIL